MALYFVRGVRADALHDGTAETAALLERLLAYPGVPRAAELPAADDPHAPVLAMHLVKGDTALRLFTTLATLGVPQDVTVQEIRVECFFPADETTAASFQAGPRARTARRLPRCGADGGYLSLRRAPRIADMASRQRRDASRAAGRRSRRAANGGPARSRRGAGPPQWGRS